MARKDVIRIAVAVVESAGRYLVGVRGPGAPLEGYHEFPGGKLEQGESPEQGAVRECLEESGLAIVPTSLLEEVDHEYSHGCVALTFLLCRPETTDPLPPAGRFSWVPREELSGLRFPDANRSIVERLVQTDAPLS